MQSSCNSIRSKEKDVEWYKSIKRNTAGTSTCIHVVHMHALQLHAFRTYPPAFGRRLVGVWQDAHPEPSQPLRTMVCTHACFQFAQHAWIGGSHACLLLQTTLTGSSLRNSHSTTHGTMRTCILFLTTCGQAVPQRFLTVGCNA